MNRVKRFAVIVALVVVGSFAIGTLGVFVFQRSLIYPAPDRAGEPRTGFIRGDGYFAVHRPGTPTVVHFHGNADVLADSDWLGDRLVADGLGFFSVEYPGYGLAAKDAVSEEAIYATVEKALVELERTVPRGQLILQGQSLGTGVATEMARRGHGSKLILISAYTSIPDVAAALVPVLPSRSLVRDKFATAEKAPGLTLPVLLIHGTADTLIPAAMGKTLSTLFPSSQLMLVEGADHNDLIDRPEVLEAIVRFAKQ